MLGTAMLDTGISKIRDFVQNLRDDVKKGTSPFTDKTIRSVAKRARKSIVYYPAILSDSISTEMLGPLVHFVQVRAAIFTRIVVTNEDPDNLRIQGKETLFKKLAGVDIREGDMGRFMTNAGDVEAGSFLVERISGRDHDYFSLSPQTMETQLNPPIHKPFLENKPSQGKGDIETVWKTDKDGKKVKYFQSKDTGVRKNQEIEVQDQKLDKMIGILPTVLHLKILVDGNENIGKELSIVLAIKAVAHMVPSMDLRNALQDAIIENSFILKILRLTSGEISFIKDFVLNLKRIKKEFVGKKGSATKIMASLKRQSDSAKNINFGDIFKKNVVPPTATIIISSDDADELEYRTNIDLKNPNTIKSLLKNHHFMSFIIVNEKPWGHFHI